MHVTNMSNSNFKQNSPILSSITGCLAGIIVHVLFRRTEFLSNEKDILHHGWKLPLSAHDSPDEIW